MENEKYLILIIPFFSFFYCMIKKYNVKKKNVLLPLFNKNLSKITVNDNILNNYDNLCSICLIDFKKEEKIIKLNCNHMYHKECIEKWFLKNSNCPFCRKEIFN